MTASDFVPDKAPDLCPTSIMTRAGGADPHGASAQATIRAMVDKNVSMTSTLAVYEPFFPNRPTKDQRTLDPMAPDLRDAYLQARRQIDSAGTLRVEFLKNAMAFEKAFYDAGGLLAAGVDPTGNGGAQILGIYDRLGSVETGKGADLVVLRGDLTADPSVIRNVITVFKDGVGFDSPRLIESVKGRVGVS